MINNEIDETIGDLFLDVHIIIIDDFILIDYFTTYFFLRNIFQCWFNCRWFQLESIFHLKFNWLITNKWTSDSVHWVEFRYLTVNHISHLFTVSYKFLHSKNATHSFIYLFFFVNRIQIAHICLCIYEMFVCIHAFLKPVVS